MYLRREFNECCIMRKLWRMMSIYLIAFHHGGAAREGASPNQDANTLVCIFGSTHLCVVLMSPSIVAGPRKLMAMADSPRGS